MRPSSVSAVLEKLIRGLCLGDFPCRQNTQREEGAGGAEEEEEEEESGALLDLLRCPRSPWHQDPSWSPQAASLRELAVRAPQRLSADFVYAFFTTLRIPEKDVRVVDQGLLKFSRLEELVLSANRITEIPAENLPRTLKVLELRSNRLGSLDGLLGRPLPCLQYLGLAANPLGSCHDAAHFTGTHWPQLVCLDLGDCEFQEQRALLDALSTLPRLRTLVLEGNPLALAAWYPGLALDRLPQLLCLDSTWISPQDRDSFRGLAHRSGLSLDSASVSVSVGSLKGIPGPLVGNNAAECPRSSYNYHVTFDFFSPQTWVKPKHDTPSQISARGSDPAAKHSRTHVRASDPEPEPNGSPAPDDRDPTVGGSARSTSKVTWSEEMNLGETRTYVVHDLDGLKRFCHRGLELKIVEEKCPVQPGSGRDKYKSKKKQAPQLLQGAPVRRELGSVHVPLRSLLRRPHKVDVLCSFGLLGDDSEVLEIQDKEGGRERKSSSPPEVVEDSQVQETRASPERPASVQSEPLTLEFSVELRKWRSTAEAHRPSP